MNRNRPDDERTPRIVTLDFNGGSHVYRNPELGMSIPVRIAPSGISADRARTLAEMLNGDCADSHVRFEVRATSTEGKSSVRIGRTADFDEYYFDFLRDKNGQLTPEAKLIREELIKEADLLQKLTNPYCANRSYIHYLMIEEGQDNNPEISQQREQLLKSVETEFIDEAEHVSNADFFDNVERAIRDHQEMFPLLNQYYIQAQ